MPLYTKKLLLPALLFIFLAFSWLAYSQPSHAAPVLQLTPFLTPTPGPDGRILYRVQSGDTLLRISLIAGIPLDELRGLNNLTSDNIVVGQDLLLGLGGPSVVTPTPGPSPTPTPLLPTPTPKQGFGVLCVLLYDDLNGDSIRQEEEPSIPDGAISISNRSGSVSETANTTTGTEPLCFAEMQEGDYSITVAVPEGYNPTTATSYDLALKAGDETYLGFGAQANTAMEIQEPVQENGGQSILLGLIGAVFLAAGVGLAIFGTRLLRAR